MTDRRYIFTVCAGRSGQNSLTHLLQSSVPDCLPLFEEPHANTRFSGRLGNWERRFRRRFVETNEMLGRGRVLKAYEQGNDDYLGSIAERRLRHIHQEMAAKNATTYFDVSKYFARGLHVGFAKKLARFSVVLLVRDPVLNMRSFLNRNKNFFLDNSRPDAPRNLLAMKTETLQKGELYLWAWCEMYLRYLKMAALDQVEAATIIPTSRLEDPDFMTAALDQISLAHEPIVTSAPRNTNASLGFKATQVQEEDVELFIGFLKKLPDDARRAITYLDDYVPGKPT